MKNYHITNDLSLSERVSDFEAMAFITNNLHKYESIEGYFCIIDRGMPTEYKLDDINIRTKALANFNTLLYREIGNLSPTRIAAFKIDVNKGQEKAVYEQIKQLGRNFCEKERRVMAIIPHWSQKGHEPFMYVLYSKPFNKSNEFQLYIDRNRTDDDSKKTSEAKEA